MTNKTPIKTPLEWDDEVAEQFGGYWGEHEDYPVSDWVTEAQNGSTRLSYWQWVRSELEFVDGYLGAAEKARER